MKSLLQSLCILLAVAFLALLSVSGVSPAGPPATDGRLNEEQRRGHAFFMQRCAFCHVPRTIKAGADFKAPGGPLLNRLFDESTPAREAVIRQIILKGIPGKMPGYEHGLEARDVEAVIEYLKTLK